jgi:hypothetical protein
MAVLAEGRDNVVSIPVVDALKMLALSVVWGSWIVVKNAAFRAVGPLWSINPFGDGGPVDKSATTAAAVAGKTAGDGSDRTRLTAHAHRDRPPPCLFTTVFGTHSYVKVKVNRVRIYARPADRSVFIPIRGRFLYTHGRH